MAESCSCSMKRLFRHVLCLMLTLTGVHAVAQTIATSQSGPWDEGATWGGTVPTASNSTLIQIDHNVTIPVSFTAVADQIVISPGVTLTINGILDLQSSGGTDLTLSEDFIIFFVGANLVVNGSFINNSLTSIDYGTGLSNITFNSGGNYIHAVNGLSLPPNNTNWDENSTCEITGVTNAVPSNLSQTFGHLTWNCPGNSGNLALGLTATTVMGNFSILNTNGPNLVTLASVAGTVVINGDFIVSGNSRFVGTSSASITIDVAGSFNFASGAANASILIPSSTNTLNFNVGGDFIVSSGTFQARSNADPTVNVIFDGNTSVPPQVFNTAGGSLVHSFNWRIVNGSTVDAGTSAFVNAGTFTLEAGATLNVGSPDGLNTGSSLGNVRVTGTRTYNANGNIVYNGSVAQNLGNEWGLSGALNGVAVNLEIANTSSSGVTNNISGSISLAGDLTLTSNPFHIGDSKTIILQGDFNGNGGTIGGLSTSNLTFNGSGASNGSLEFVSGGQTLNNLSIDRSGIITLGTPLTISGTLSFPSSGNLRIDGQPLTVNGDITQIGSGALISNSSSDLIIGGTGTLSALPFCTSCGTMALNDVTLGRTTGGAYTWNTAVTINGTLNINSGILTHSSGLTMADNSTILMSGGSLTGTSPIAASDYNVHYTAAGNTGLELPVSASALFDLTVENSVTLTSPISINGTFSIGSGGSLSVGTNDITMNGASWNIVNGTFNPGTAKVTFSRVSPGITLSGTSSFYDLEVTTGDVLTLSSANTNIANELIVDGTLNHGSGTVTFNGSAGTITNTSAVSFNHLAITGTLTAPATMNVAGTFTSSGTFTHNAGTVVFNGNSSIVGSPVFHSITVTGLLSCPSPGTLTLQGDLRVNDSGNFNTVSGTVLFNGTANQRIDRTSGSAATIDFFNITIDKASGTFNVFSTVSGTIFRLRNILTILQNGVTSPDIDFDGPSDNGTFLLRSTDTRTARIDEVPASVTVQGNISVERYVENAEGLLAYRYFTSPVSGATVADWQNTIPVIGRFSNPSPAPRPNTPSIYVYQETLGGLLDNRWAPYPNGSGPPFLNPASSYPLANGRGYAVFVNTTGTPTLTVRGTLVTGDVTIPLTFTGSSPDAGYNLIGNPYPAPVDWDVVTRPAEVSPIINLKDNVGNAGLTAGQFIYYDATDPNTNVGNFTGVLASGQAFGVFVSGATSLTIRESDKTVTPIDPIVVREGFAGRIKIRVEGNGRADETIIRLKNGATKGYDFGLDAVKLTNDYVNLYTFFDTPAGKLAINSISEFNCSESISIGIRKVEPGTHTFDFSDIESIEGDFDFVLLDHFTGGSLNLKNTSKYSFEVTEDTLSFGDNRFKLVVSQENINTAIPVLAGGNICLGQEGKIEILNSQSSVEYFAMKDGIKISENYSGSGNTIDISVPNDVLTAGTNEIVVMAQIPGCNPVQMAQSATLQVADIYSPEVAHVKNCGAGEVTLQAIGAPDDGSYFWYEKIDDTKPISGATGSTFVTPVLEKTKTYYVAIANSIGCEGKRVEVKAEILHYEPASISLSNENTTLSSNYSEGNQWFFDNAILEGATAQHFVPEESGVYRVEVTVGNCTTSAEREFVVTATSDPGYKVLIHPNPARDFITVNVPHGKNTEVRLFDALGRFLGETRLHGEEGNITATFDIKDNPSGLYLIKITTGRTTEIYKFIKE